MCIPWKVKIALSCPLIPRTSSSAEDGACCDQSDQPAHTCYEAGHRPGRYPVTYVQCQHWLHSSFSAQSQVFVYIWELNIFESFLLGWAVGLAVVVSGWMKRHRAVTRKPWFPQKPNWKISKGFLPLPGKTVLFNFLYSSLNRSLL